MDPKFDMFGNRLEKVHKHISKWARRQGITCYRIYDDDMPEFPLAIDRYEEIIHVSEYAREHTLSPQEHADWLARSIGVISDKLDVHPDRIYLKYRQRQKGLSQYERFRKKGDVFIARENGLRFYINPSDYLDTGLFLDHRNTRQMVMERSAGKKVLNLFCYTGSFSVYAAAGGASQTLSVDLSNTYLQWAARNLDLNGFSGMEHRLLQADILDWLLEPGEHRWDIVVLDPPTFSNSKRMQRALDIQRDHAFLINAALEKTAPEGVVFFSTNFRRFKLSENEIKSSQIKDISKQTVPEDFRNKRIHQCFLISK